MIVSGCGIPPPPAIESNVVAIGLPQGNRKVQLGAKLELRTTSAQLDRKRVRHARRIVAHDIPEQRCAVASVDRQTTISSVSRANRLSVATP
jgi:hypothetical protein